jgi:hypothetical protein
LVFDPALVVVPLGQQGHGQVGVGAGMAGIEGNGLPVGGNRGGPVAAALPGHAAVHMGLGKAGPQGQGLAVGGEGALEVAQGLEGIA